MAIVRNRAAVAHRPGRPEFAGFQKLNVNGVPTVFSIRAEVVDAKCKPRAYLVQVPTRPNGVTGWVSARQVDVATVKTRILVDLSEKRVTLAAHPGRYDGSIRSGRDRHLGLLGRPHRVGAGRPDRHPRDERAVVDREGRLQRLHPASQRDSEESLRAGPERNARGYSALAGGREAPAPADPNWAPSACCLESARAWPAHVSREAAYPVTGRKRSFGPAAREAGDGPRRRRDPTARGPRFGPAAPRPRFRRPRLGSRFVSGRSRSGCTKAPQPRAGHRRGSR